MTMTSDQQLATTDAAPRRLAMITWLTDQAPNYALSVAYNSTVTMDRVQRDLDKLHGLLDRRLFGPRFHAIEADRRTWWAAFVEHLSSNTHAHLVVRVVADKAARFQALWPGDRSMIWSLLAPAGSCDLKPIADRDSAFGWATYVTKNERHIEQMILSRTVGSA